MDWLVVLLLCVSVIGPLGLIAFWRWRERRTVDRHPAPGAAGHALRLLLLALPVLALFVALGLPPSVYVVVGLVALLALGESRQ